MDISELKDIVASLKRLKGEERLERLDDNVLFDSAVRMYNSLMITRARFGEHYRSGGQDRQAALQGAAVKGVEVKTEIGAVEKWAPMSDKQKKLLKDLNYQGNMNISKQEATKLIQDLLDKQKEAA